MELILKAPERESEEAAGCWVLLAHGGIEEPGDGALHTAEPRQEENTGTKKRTLLPLVSWASS